MFDPEVIEVSLEKMGLTDLKVIGIGRVIFPHPEKKDYAFLPVKLEDGSIIRISNNKQSWDHCDPRLYLEVMDTWFAGTMLFREDSSEYDKVLTPVVPLRSPFKDEWEQRDQETSDEQWARLIREIEVEKFKKGQRRGWND